MAVRNSKSLFLRTLTSNYSQKHFVPLTSYNARFSVSAARENSQRFRKAMEVYLEKIRENDEFMKQQNKEFEKGKKHLANMMGMDVNKMTQEDIDDSIQYLLPSGLFIKKARPFMKPPNEIFKKKSTIQLDMDGRPYNFLFYTTKPNFYSLLHNAAVHLENMNDRGAKMQKAGMIHSNPISFVGSAWLTKLELETLLDEKLYPIEYDKFLEIFNILAEHPCNELAENFIKMYRKNLDPVKTLYQVTPEVAHDGSIVINIPRVTRDRAEAQVTLKFPGKGVLKINNQGLDYFPNMQSREQVLFPLIFTEMLEKVDIEAVLNGGGITGQAGALRLGISMALETLVTPEMKMKMKLAGLLQKDVRMKERKKPGQEGARRKYTWLKR